MKRLSLKQIIDKEYYTNYDYEMKTKMYNMFLCFVSIYLPINKNVHTVDTLANKS